MIDLKQEYGKRYKVTLDESCGVERNKKAEDRLWYDEIHGRRGWAYIQNLSTLALEIKRSLWGKFERLKPFPFTLARYGDDFVKVLVDEKNVDKALRFIVPRKRRQLTDEQKAAISARLQKYKFQPAR